jgi:hypothetical protein
METSEMKNRATNGADVLISLKEIPKNLAVL